MSEIYPVDMTTEAEGVFAAHWEVSWLKVRSGTGLLGRPKFEYWLPHFPSGFVLPHYDDANWRHSPGRMYEMRVRGRVGPKGHFGHRGLCSREIFVDEIITWREIASRGAEMPPRNPSDK